MRAVVDDLKEALKPVARWAENWGNKVGIYGFSTEERRAGIDDDLDAFRHTFFSAISTSYANFAVFMPSEINIHIGELGTKIGEFFTELPTIGGQSASYCSSFMDKHNNSVGRDLAPTPQTVLRWFLSLENPTHKIAEIVAEAVHSEKTINGFNDSRMPKECLLQSKKKGTGFRWSTENDDKVRLEHSIREGKIYDWKQLSPDELPGAAFGCRCVAEPVDE